ncbi:MAG: hypothetical protein II875_02645 [Clostridia bacterium]|nr:hypothetical protein [Clostridia bacterium]
MSEEKIVFDGDEITQALEDMRSQYSDPGESQTEKSKRAVMEEIRAMIRSFPEMSNKDIALAVGSTPKQVAAQRYMMSEKGKAQAARYIEKRREPEAHEAAKEEKAPENVCEAGGELSESGPKPPVGDGETKLDAVVRCVTFAGKIAEYDVDMVNGEIDIIVKGDAVSRSVPFSRLGEMIAELTALKKQLEAGTFARWQK